MQIRFAVLQKVDKISLPIHNNQKNKGDFVNTKCGIISLVPELLSSPVYKRNFYVTILCSKYI